MDQVPVLLFKGHKEVASSEEKSNFHRCSEVLTEVHVFSSRFLCAELHAEDSAQTAIAVVKHISGFIVVIKLFGQAIKAAKVVLQTVLQPSTVKVSVAVLLNRVC